MGTGSWLSTPPQKPEQEGNEPDGDTRFNPPPPGEDGVAGAGAVLKAAVLACGMLRATTRQPEPTVPTARLRLGCGGSAYRLTCGQGEGIRGTHPASQPQRCPPPSTHPHGDSRQVGVKAGGTARAGGTAGHRPCLSFPTHRAVQGGRWRG